MSKEGLTAEFIVKNNGSFSGSAVPMMFLTFPENIGEYPEYIFKGFEKIELEPGETVAIIIKADEMLFLILMLKKINILKLMKEKLKFILVKMAILMIMSFLWKLIVNFKFVIILSTMQ